jgi:tetratricopeptide (TPR) repeat protein
VLCVFIIGVFIIGTLTVAVGAKAGPLDEARRMATEGDPARASAELEALLPVLPEPQRAEALYLLASYASDWGVAEGYYGQVLDEHRESAWAAPSLIELGEHAVFMGNPARAQVLFEEAVTLSIDPEEHAWALLRDAQALLLMDQPGEARLRLRRLLDDVPEGSFRDRAVLTLSACAYREGDYSESLRQSLELLGRGSEVEPTALLTAGQSLLARGEVDLSLEYLRQLATDYPDSPDGAVARAVADSLDTHFGVERAWEAMEDSVFVPEPEPEPMWAESLAIDIPTPDQSPIPLATTGTYYVRLGRFSDRIGAFGVISRLRRRGVDNAELHRQEGEDGAIFRIRIGPYATREEADAQLALPESQAGVRGSVEAEDAP